MSLPHHGCCHYLLGPQQQLLLQERVQLLLLWG
jgi:hypothetical protein